MSGTYLRGRGSAMARRNSDPDGNAALLVWFSTVRLLRPARLCVVGVFVAFTAGACKRQPPTELVVGVQSEPMGGVVSLLHVVIKVAGVVARDETIRPPNGSTVGFPHPWEARLIAKEDPHALVDVQVDALGSAGASEPPLLT